MIAKEMIKAVAKTIVQDVDDLQKNRAYIQDLYKKSCLFSEEYQERLGERYHDLLDLNLSKLKGDL